MGEIVVFNAINKNEIIDFVNTHATPLSSTVELCKIKVY